MATNKVIFGGETVVDLTQDTVSSDKLFQGETAHNAAGELITGTVVTQSFNYLGTILDRNTNWNNLKTNGIYDIGYEPGFDSNTMANGTPSNAVYSYGVLEIIGHGNIWVQRYTPHKDVDNRNFEYAIPSLCIREAYGGDGSNWSSYRYLYDVKYIPIAAAGLIVEGNDFNDFVYPGTYKVQYNRFAPYVDTMHTPKETTYPYGILEVLVSQFGGEARICQIYYPHLENNEKIIQCTRMRNGTAHEWTNWRYVVNQEGIQNMINNLALTKS